MVSFTNTAIGVAAALATTVSANGALCPYNYPVGVNTTSSHNGLTFAVTLTQAAATDNRALQLRPNPNLKGGSYVGIDASSPVLLSNLAGGAVKSQARNNVNQLYDLGPTLYINLRDQTNTTSPQGVKGYTKRYTVGFANSSIVTTGPSGGPGAVDNHWSLTGSGSDGTYGLYRSDEPTGISYGFQLCKADFDTASGAWYQLLWTETKGNPASFPNCQGVGIRTTVAASIINGDCNIAGYRST